MNSNPQEDLLSLIDGIVKAITSYNISPKELGDALIEVMERRGNKMPEINYVLDTVAADYAISRKVLREGTGREHSYARRFVYCLLYYDLRLPLAQIAEQVFGTPHVRRISEAISEFRTMDAKIKAHREFLTKYETYQKGLQDFILRKTDSHAK